MAKKAAVKESEVVEETTDFEDEFTKIAEAKQAAPDLDSDTHLEQLDEKAEELKAKEAAAAKDGDPNAEAAKEEAAAKEAATVAAAKKALDKDPDILDPDKKKPVADPVVDPYEGMDEATKAKFVVLEESNTKLTHRLDSDSGRVSAFQKQVTGLKRENTDLKAAGPAAKPTPNQIADAMKGTDENWDQFKEDYPDVARAIDSRLEIAGKATQESVEQTLAPVIDKQAQINTNAANTATQTKVDAVAKIYPEWSAAVQTPDFVDWLADQPPGIAALSESDDTNDASALIGMYDAHLVENGKPSLKAPTPEPASKKEDEVTDGADATALAKKRTQQLEDGTTIDSKNAKIDAGSEPLGDFETAFAFHAKRKDAKRATA